MIHAFVTLYNPSNQVIENVKSIAEQVDSLFLCDNSTGNNGSMFESVANEKTEYIANFENLGLSGAFNKVLKNEKYHFADDDFLIFFDQDSTIQDGHIEGLITQFNKIVEKKVQIGCIGPVYFNKSNGTVEIPHDKKLVLESNLNNEVKYSWEVKSIITSSMLTTYGRLKAINFFNEGIFLDFVDWDVCWRFMANGLVCCMTDAVKLIHSVGEGDIKFGMLRLRVASPFRVYYQTRDSLYLLREKYVPVKFKVRLFVRITVEAVVHVIFLPNRGERIHYYFKGLNDYIHRIHGALKKSDA